MIPTEPVSAIQKYDRQPNELQRLNRKIVRAIKWLFNENGHKFGPPIMWPIVLPFVPIVMVIAIVAYGVCWIAFEAAEITERTNLRIWKRVSVPIYQARDFVFGQGDDL